MKKLVVSLFIATCSITNAQTIGNSPYASYGIGDVKYDNSIETISMGGISTAYVWDFNNQFNFQNPAANSNLELTSLKFQATNENQYLKSSENKYNKHSTYVSGLSLAFPISKKLKFGIKYSPYSSKDYNITQSINLPDGTSGKQNFAGSGSINLVQMAFGYHFTPSFSLGIRSNLFFGKLYDTEETSYNHTTLINSRENQVNVNNFNFTVGSVYQQKLKNNKKLTFGATYTLGNTSDFESSFKNSTYYLYNNTKTYQSNISESNQKAKNILGKEFSLGIGYGHEAKWFVSTQFNYKNGTNTTAFNKTFDYQDSYRFSVGGWYLPNYNNFRNYFSRVTYRYGAFFEKGNLQINDASINKYGISFGSSFPFQKSNINRLSSIDLSIELGQKGTLKNNLIRENFLNFTIGINFANKWFEKQYYD